MNLPISDPVCEIGDTNTKEASSLKQHRFWAWGAVVCMVMVMITGYQHK